MDLEKNIKIAQSISFTTFLILCVGVLSYAMFHLYTDSRTDWSQVQINSQNIGQMSSKVDALIDKIDGLLTELNTCLRTSPTIVGAPSVPSTTTPLVPFATPHWVGSPGAP